MMNDGRIQHAVELFDQQQYREAFTACVEIYNQRFFGGEIGPFSAQKILLEDAQVLLFGKEQLHGFQRGKAVSAGKQGVKIPLGIAQVGQQVVHPFQRRQHLESPTFA